MSDLTSMHLEFGAAVEPDLLSPTSFKSTSEASSACLGRINRTNSQDFLESEDSGSPWKPLSQQPVLSNTGDDKTNNSPVMIQTQQFVGELQSTDHFYQTGENHKIDNNDHNSIASNHTCANLSSQSVTAAKQESTLSHPEPTSSGFLQPVGDGTSDKNNTSDANIRNSGEKCRILALKREFPSYSNVKDVAPETFVGNISECHIYKSPPPMIIIPMNGPILRESILGKMDISLGHIEEVIGVPSNGFVKLENNSSDLVEPSNPSSELADGCVFKGDVQDTEENSCLNLEAEKMMNSEKECLYTCPVKEEEKTEMNVSLVKEAKPDENTQTVKTEAQWDEEIESLATNAPLESCSKEKNDSSSVSSVDVKNLGDEPDDFYISRLYEESGRISSASIETVRGSPVYNSQSITPVILREEEVASRIRSENEDLIQCGDEPVELKRCSAQSNHSDLASATSRTTYEKGYSHPGRHSIDSTSTLSEGRISTESWNEPGYVKKGKGSGRVVESNEMFVMAEQIVAMMRSVLACENSGLSKALVEGLAGAIAGNDGFQQFTKKHIMAEKQNEKRFSDNLLSSGQTVRRKRRFTSVGHGEENLATTIREQIDKEISQVSMCSDKMKVPHALEVAQNVVRLNIKPVNKNTVLDHRHIGSRVSDRRNTQTHNNTRYNNNKVANTNTQDRIRNSISKSHNNNNPNNGNSTTTTSSTTTNTVRQKDRNVIESKVKPVGSLTEHKARQRGNMRRGPVKVAAEIDNGTKTKENAKKKEDEEVIMNESSSFDWSDNKDAPVTELLGLSEDVIVLIQSEMREKKRAAVSSRGRVIKRKQPAGEQNRSSENDKKLKGEKKEELETVLLPSKLPKPLEPTRRTSLRRMGNCTYIKNSNK